MLDHVSPAGVLVPPRFITPHSETRQGREYTSKMAARWGAGEETLTACNMDFFTMDSLDETAVLSDGETLEALQSCLDPSLLSMFEDTPTIETKGLDEESEATLLTALTEILDNVDDENLSPFDTLPDSDLLSGQKGREHSPLRRLLCLSRSPPEKDTLCNMRPSSTGKSLPRILADSLQRSDGEEEEDGSFTLSPVSHDSCPDSDLLDWKGLTLPLPITFEQEDEEGVSVCLGDLVRHMHPYCMTISLENDEGEQMLPEGGILLEVVDQGENGEPILAIPDMDLPVSLALKEDELKEEDDGAASDSSEHIVVDDEDESVTVSPMKVATPVTSSLKDEMIVVRQKKEIREKSPSRRKKKKKSKERHHPEPVEGRVLRSGRVRNTAQESPKKSEKRSIKEKKHKVPKVPPASTQTSSSSQEPKKLKHGRTETQQEVATTTLSPVTKIQDATSVPSKQEAALSIVSCEKSPPVCSNPELSSKRPEEEKPEQLEETLKKQEDSSAAPSPVSPPVPSESATAAAGPLTAPVTPLISEAPPPVALAVPEPKPKSLSLAEYRRLRQQKKPAPVEKQDDNSTKWPSLPELPKELPPIPCLPDPTPKDLRRPNPVAAKKEVEEVRPAWQPRGPCAPPTPEALLVPPAYMVASNSKASAATATPKPQQTPEQPKPSPPQNPPAANSMKPLPSHQETTAPPAAPSVPQSSESPASVKPTAQLMSAERKCSPEHPKSLPVSAELTQTTTEMIKPAAAATVSAPRKITVVFPKVPEVKAPTSLNTSSTSDSKPSKPTADGMKLSTPRVELQSLKEDPVVLENKDKPTTALKPHRAKCPTQELIEAFTSEIGIEAADLTSLLEQFEETQAKEEQCVPEVSGRAAAVGNSSVELAPEKTVVERVRANDLSSTAALTPPATPPHQMWKPLTPVALLGKSKASEASKSSPSKIIQIEARPLPSVRSRTKPIPSPAAASVTPEVACMDHDYCLPAKGTSNNDSGKRWNVKQQTFITIKPITTQTPPAAPSSSTQSNANAAATSKSQVTLRDPLDNRTDNVERSSVLETPDASPSRSETDVTVKEASSRGGPYGRSYRRHAASRTPSPRSSCQERTGGRSRKRRSRRSPSPMSSGSVSDSHSSRSRSRSHSPPKKRYRSCHRDRSSSSSSCSSSRSSSPVSRSPPRRRRYSYSSSCSGSWSRSRSRSRSPQRQTEWSRGRRLHSPLQRPQYVAKMNTEEVKRCKEKAIEERRVVYVGRIRGTMTQKELKDRFSLFGEIEDCTLHFRDHGDNYGFVTYYSTKEAFTAIENGSKLRKPDELPFDLCFGGRRQFCKTSYADLDSNREYEPMSARGKLNTLDFDTLLKQAKQNQKR
ncbi:peroxisome proliferator-activated receptor gamma coactivator-related protein 1 [Notolabrus celidotus]|uniref:peroxisome proliferator-activated receptor gamma coactivator-related protein 1 n=1 Tax=Notolabrus celidotus TaxID=1203425 RepID=UPI00148F8BD2|nr:peroxisome proliferator-activated receptor gamma coactivator-related protein 1 [Notolabrus celidotus]